MSENESAQAKEPAPPVTEKAPTPHAAETRRPAHIEERSGHEPPMVRK